MFPKPHLNLVSFWSDCVIVKRFDLICIVAVTGLLNKECKRTF